MVEEDDISLAQSGDGIGESSVTTVPGTLHPCVLFGVTLFTHLSLLLVLISAY